MTGLLPVSAGLVMGFHFKSISYGKIAVAVGVFILVGAPSVSTIRSADVGPYPIVFWAVTLKFILILGVNTTFDVTVYCNTRPSISNEVSDTQFPVP